MSATAPAPPTGEPDSVSMRLRRRIARAIDDAGGWLPFDRYMALALYEPELGYYAGARTPFGRWVGDGSDFVTAPELTPLYGRTLARQVQQAMDACGVDTVLEFGAGSGALAEQLIEALGGALRRYRIVELSGSLRARQQQRLARFGERVQWLQHTPEAIEAVVVGNEVLDAMPVKLLAFDGEHWHERGVVRAGDGAFGWRDAAQPAAAPYDGRFAPGTVTELHAQAQAFVASLVGWLRRGAAFFVDYGFPAHEYYHPQRSGTLMCHRAHRADTDPLQDPGEKDITAHLDFSAIALAAQRAGAQVLGYTSQARFLMNCGLLDLIAAGDARERAAAQKLLAEHEMGELFKVIGFAAAGCSFDAIGFAAGDRTHRL